MKIGKKRAEEKQKVETQVPKEIRREDPVEVISPPKLFTTTDKVLARKLEDKFTYRNISIDSSNPHNEIVNFTFNATEKEVEDYLRGEK